MHRTSTAKTRAFTLVEVVVAAGLLALSAIVSTQAMLVLNKNSAVARVRNLAKAEVLSRIQEAGAVTFDPYSSPKVVPTPLVESTGTAVSINLGDASTGLGLLPAQLSYAVARDSSTELRTVTCGIECTYLGRKIKYEAVTYRSPD